MRLGNKTIQALEVCAGVFVLLFWMLVWFIPWC